MNNYFYLEMFGGKRSEFLRTLLPPNNGCIFLHQMHNCNALWVMYTSGVTIVVVVVVWLPQPSEGPSLTKCTSVFPHKWNDTCDDGGDSPGREMPRGSHRGHVERLMKHSLGLWIPHDAYHMIPMPSHYWLTSLVGSGNQTSAILHRDKQNVHF